MTARAYHITAVELDDWKRIEHIEFSPDTDSHLILISGKNASGKTSLLGGLSAAFGGADEIPPDPVRHGAESASIRVVLDGGDLVIKRTVTKDGKSKLELRDAEGSKLSSPQERLDKIIGARFLDPLAFLQLPTKDQRKALLGLIDKDGTIAKLDERRGRVYERRTEVGRDHKKLEAQLGAAPEVAPGQPVDMRALTDELQVINDRHRTCAELVRHRDVTSRELEAQAARIERIERQLTELAAELEVAELAVDTVKEQLARDEAELAGMPADNTADRRKEIQASLETATATNRQVAVDEERAKQRASLVTEVARLAGGLTTLNAEIEKIDADKATFLSAAKLPVDGLDVDAEGVRFRGVPLSQASGAEQLRVALALAIVASPNLRDVWVRDGSLLDDDSLEVLAREAEAAGVRCWVERVGVRDPGAIIIEDGRIRPEASRVAG